MDASQGRIAVVVALITVLGGITTGVLTNWDKLFGSGPAQQASANAAPAASTAVARDAGAAAGGVAADETATQAASASVPNIAGTWNDPNGMPVQIQQDGSGFAIQRNVDGVQILLTQGRLDGHRIRYPFAFAVNNVAVTGQCDGYVRTVNLIEVQCTFENGGTVPGGFSR